MAKRFGEKYAVRDVDITINPGEFFSVLGPSGCGKTTVLRMVAGFIEPSEGQVRIGGRDMRGLGPDRRPTGMIFQSLALFPLMPVWENVAFGLEARGVAKAERRRRAEALLELVALGGYGDRLPGALSGGQRQRVAIARALAVEPKVLLLDEPLSALDLKLRQHMRAELRGLQKRTGVTFIYITHDQSEALAMSDQVAVMSEGRLEQVGTPRQLYDEPTSSFVARFIGETNAIAGKVIGLDADRAMIEGPAGRFVGRAGPRLAIGAPATLFVRPEALAPALPMAENVLSAKVEGIDFEGAFGLVHATTETGLAVIAAITSTRLAEAPGVGETASLAFAARDAVVLAND
ncbi:MAG: ABC transporter ATP-binding protein [Geminicoccaceae bacterium]